MEETVVVVMLKNMQTGFLEKELLSFALPRHENLLVNLFARETEGETLAIHLRLSTGQDVENWQFNAIYDYYDTQIFGEEVTYLGELEDSYNPTWEVSFNCPQDLASVPETIAAILDLHHQELQSVYEAIKDQEDSYSS